MTDKASILVIDDEELIRWSIGEHLRGEGFSVLEAEDGDKGFALIEATSPDLILTDIHMPEAKGTDICRTLKNEYGTQDIPIILFSSLPDDELSKLAEQVGADGSLSKVNGLEKMGEKIDELVQSIIW